MAPMLVPLKCGFHFQRRKLAYLLRQTSSFHHWNSCVGDTRTDPRRQNIHVVSEGSACWGGRSVFSVTVTGQGQWSWKWFNFSESLMEWNGQSFAVISSCRRCDFSQVLTNMRRRARTGQLANFIFTVVAVLRHLFEHAVTWVFGNTYVK